MIRQKTGSGCGIYAVANATLNKKFITKDRQEKSVKGNTIPLLNKWMIDDGLSYNIEALYYNHFAQKLPKNALGYHPMNDGHVLPMLMLVSDKKVKDIAHMVAVHVKHDRSAILFDSLENEPIDTTLEEINKSYDRVYGLFCFVDVNSGDHIFLS